MRPFPILGLLTALAACQAMQPFQPEPWPEKEQADPDGPAPVVIKTAYYRLTDEKSHSLTCSQDEASGEWTLTVSGEDPYLFTEPLEKDLPADSCYVTFEYKASADIDDFQLFLPYPVTEERSVRLGPLAAAEEWTLVERDLRAERKALGWGKAGDALRLDWGTTSPNDIRLRRLYVRAQTEAERKAEIAAGEAAGKKEAMASRLNNYLSASYAGAITSVSVNESSVTISGNAPSADCALAELSPWENVAETDSWPSRQMVPEGAFSMTLPRRLLRAGAGYDRLLSKWILVRKGAHGWERVSSARHADAVTPVYSPADLPLKNKKGLGGMRANETFYSDLDALNIGSVTLNVTLDNFIGTQPFSSDEEIVYNGTTYHINLKQVDSYDKRLAQCASRGIVASAIILLARNPSDPAMKEILLHPEFNPEARYSMPNFTSRAGVNAYAAALDYLARRYDGENGGRRISHWILHNEVDFATTWTNMGDQPLPLLLDNYVRSMRLCSIIARQYNPSAQVLISLTHCWTRADGPYAPRDMLDGLLAMCAAEGDFPWGLAYHPYPENLWLPGFWANDVNSTYAMDTPYITFKNLEVLDAWVKAHPYKGAKRLCFLSENGTCSPSYSASDLALQAAGAAWAWKKVSALDGIDAIQWHNWMDDAGEGVKIGLRYPSDDPVSPGGAKPVWDVWKAAGTASEDAAFASSLPIIGISSWNDIFGTVE